MWTWRSSSRCNAVNGNCVEVGAGPGGMAGVRDTKDRDGGLVQVRAADWAAFLSTVRSGQLRPHRSR